MKAVSQDHLLVKNIHDDLIILKDGSASLVLKTSAVNFDLLSAREQMGIIDAFAALLNSLSFAIQIVIRSKKLDISDYLNKLRDVEEHQSNPLMITLMKNYINFVETIIRENEVLDKQFYIVVTVSYLELGFVASNVDKNIQKALTILTPRRDHVIRQLNRIGLKAQQLDTEELVKLFYNYYNESPQNEQESLENKLMQAPTQASGPTSIADYAQVVPKTPNPIQSSQPITQAQPVQPPVEQSQIPQPITNIQPPKAPTITFQKPQTTPMPINQRPLHRSTPFVVEELTDDYGAI